MDPESFLDIANQVIKLKMFPYFDIAHSLLSALSVKEDLGPGAHAFSRKHPLACWLSTMLVVFAGGMVASALLGEPILGPLKNSPQLLVATICWYVVFYTPFDIGYKVSKFLPVKLVASAMKEIYRAKKVIVMKCARFAFLLTLLFSRSTTELCTPPSFTPTPTSS